MIIMPNTVKRQGNVTTGIITLCIAFIIASVSAVVAYFLFKAGTNFFYVPVVIGGFLSIGGIVMGTIEMVKGIKVLKVMRDGYKSSCKIVFIGHRTSATGNGGGSPYMVVQYKSQTNQERLLRVYLNFRNVFRLRLGMVIECYILNEDCYVNTKEEIKIIEAPEEMSIKDTIKSLFKDANQVPFNIYLS